MSSIGDDERLGVIDSATRSRLVRAALSDNDAVLTSWHESEMAGGGTNGTVKVSGEARSHGERLPWSMIIKWFQSGADPLGGPSNIDPSSRGYWRREWLLYQGRWFAGSASGLSTPHLLGAAEVSPSTAWVALEDLTQYDERPWSLARFGAFARQVGAFNGAFLTGPALPAEPWLSHGWLREWCGSGDPVSVLESGMGNPVVRSIFSGSLVANLRWVWQTREAMFDVLDGLPQTLCHQDLHPRNVFFRPTARGGQAVAVDWAECGSAPVGAEIAGLVGSSIFLFEAERIDADELEKQCLEGYLSGLGDVECSCTRNDVHLAYLISLVLRFAVGLLELVVGLATDDKNHAWAEHILGKPIGAFFQNFHEFLEFLQPRIAHVRQIAERH